MNKRVTMKHCHKLHNASTLTGISLERFLCKVRTHTKQFAQCAGGDCIATKATIAVACPALFDGCIIFEQWRLLIPTHIAIVQVHAYGVECVCISICSHMFTSSCFIIFPYLADVRVNCCVTDKILNDLACIVVIMSPICARRRDYIFNSWFCIQMNKFHNVLDRIILHIRL